jgi:hypothetical protein
MKFKPPTFSGSTDPIVAENWIKAMERIFRIIQKKVSEEDKVNLATYMLENESMHWWETVQDRLGAGKGIEWSEFKTQFLAKHFPKTFRYQLERDFINLTQEDKSILQYEQEFNQLSRYAPTLVSDEAAKIRRFIEGLIPSIRRMVAVLDVGSFRQAVDLASVCESENARNWPKETTRVDRKRKVETLTPAPLQQQQKLTATPKIPKKQCGKCNGNHRTEQCKHKVQKCFRCHETGHMIADCQAPSNQD